MQNRKVLFNQDDIESKVSELQDLILAESKKVSGTSKVFVAGFSQGCSMANSILVSWPGPEPLGGVVCTSGIIALEESRFNQTKEALSA